MSDDLDSDRIVTHATNRNVRVWDRETGDQIDTETEIDRQAAGLEPTTERNGDLIGGILDTDFAIWNDDIDTWPALACDIAGRNMTQREWSISAPGRRVPGRLLRGSRLAPDGGSVRRAGR